MKKFKFKIRIVSISNVKLLLFLVCFKSFKGHPQFFAPISFEEERVWHTGNVAVDFKDEKEHLKHLKTFGKKEKNV